MAMKKDAVDAVIIGLGWTGSIMAKVLTDEGLKVVALERGPNKDTADAAAYPQIADELAYAVRGKLFQPLAKETVTIRHRMSETAVPYRQHASFLLGNGVGGAGFHWNGQHWRALPEDLRIRSHFEERYGKDFIPEGMTIQDYGVTYEELEPYFTHFEEVCGTSGKAGNINGQMMPGGNPLEAPRSKEYPLPPSSPMYVAQLFAKAAKEAGYDPFPLPASNASQAYTNPYGVRLGPCNFCGFCERFGCYMYSKASPQTTILPVIRHRSNLEIRANSYVTKINLDASGKKATGVTYIDGQGNEVEQPADLVIVSAYQMHNVRLLLLSGIGKPYDPVTGEGVVGKNYAYQYNPSVTVMMPKGTHMNPFIGAGAAGMYALDNFNGDQFDHGPLGFVGGAYTSAGFTGGRPILQTSLPKGAPTWGKGWQAAVADTYERKMSIGMEGSVMAYRDAYLDLDPTYKDAAGLPLLRMTFNWHDNEIKMGQYVVNRAAEIAKHLGAESYSTGTPGSTYDTRIYQSTHTTGGAIMGADPKTSVINKYLQCWDVPNVFVTGASAFPQNLAYNPTGLVGALAYHAAQALKDQYLKNPGPLVQA